MGRISFTRYLSPLFPCFHCYEFSFDLYILLNSFQFFVRSQIDRHFNEFSSTDMTIEKLQKIVTCPVEASFKAKWLHWWNAPLRERSENKFPIDKPMREKALDDWLHKASFWAQVYPFLGLLILIFYSSCFIANHLPHFSWRKKSRSRLKPFRRPHRRHRLGRIGDYLAPS